MRVRWPLACKHNSCHDNHKCLTTGISQRNPKYTYYRSLNNYVYYFGVRAPNPILLIKAPTVSLRRLLQLPDAGLETLTLAQKLGLLLLRLSRGGFGA